MLQFNILIIISFPLGFACPASRRHKKTTSTRQPASINPVNPVNCLQTPMAPGCLCHATPMKPGCPCHKTPMMHGCPCKTKPLLPECPKPVNCQLTPLHPQCPRPPPVNCQQQPTHPQCQTQSAVYFGGNVFHCATPLAYKHYINRGHSVWKWIYSSSLTRSRNPCLKSLKKIKIFSTMPFSLTFTNFGNAIII